MSLKRLNNIFAIEALSLKTASLCVVFALAEITIMTYLIKLFNKLQEFIEKRLEK